MRDQMKLVQEDIKELKAQITEELVNQGRVFVGNDNIKISLIEKDEKKKSNKKEVVEAIEQIIMSEGMDDRTKKDEIIKAMGPRVIGIIKALRISMNKKKKKD